MMKRLKPSALPAFITLILMFCTISLIACTPVPITEVDAETLGLPSTITDIYSVVWLADDTIVLSSMEDIWLKVKNSETWEKRTLEQLPDCFATHYVNMQRLPDGNLGFIQSCTHIDSETNRFVAYNVAEDELMLLSDEYVPGTGNISWREDMEVGIYNNSKYAFGTLYWVDRTSLEPVSLTLSDGDKKWFLPDSINAKLEYSHQERPDLLPYSVGLLRDPQFTGDSILFWATLDPQAKQFEFLSSQSYDLYLYNPQTEELSTLLKDVIEPDYMEMSPDEAWIVYQSAKRLWLYSLHSNEQVAFAEGQFRGFAWDSSSQEILALSCLEISCSSIELITFDVSEIVIDE